MKEDALNGASAADRELSWLMLFAQPGSYWCSLYNLGGVSFISTFGLSCGHGVWRMWLYSLEASGVATADF
jgi:hypothetical protein